MFRIKQLAMGIVIVAALGTVGIVSAIGFSTQVHAQATVVKGGSCTGPDKACTMVVTAPSNNPAGPNTNVESQAHNTGFAPQGPGATVFPKTCPESVGNECGGGVITPSGNENLHLHNATSP